MVAGHFHARSVRRRPEADHGAGDRARARTPPAARWRPRAARPARSGTRRGRAPRRNGRRRAPRRTRWRSARSPSTAAVEVGEPVDGRRARHRGRVPEAGDDRERRAGVIAAPHPRRRRTRRGRRGRRAPPSRRRDPRTCRGRSRRARAPRPTDTAPWYTPFHQRARGRHLVQRVVLDAEELRERARSTRWSTGAPLA